jgi:hypothetical protein
VYTINGPAPISVESSPVGSPGDVIRERAQGLLRKHIGEELTHGLRTARLSQLS